MEAALKQFKFLVMFDNQVNSFYRGFQRLKAHLILCILKPNDINCILFWICGRNVTENFLPLFKLLKTASFSPNLLLNLLPSLKIFWKPNSWVLILFAALYQTYFSDHIGEKQDSLNLYWWVWPQKQFGYCSFSSIRIYHLAIPKELTAYSKNA